MVPDSLDGSKNHEDATTDPPVNPLVRPVSIWSEFLNRIKLFDWWVAYNKGTNYESKLTQQIIRLGSNAGFPDKWSKKLLRHAISEFSKKGLGIDYYGYHNMDHELEAALFTILAAINQPHTSRFTQEEMAYLFVAALFHDYDPLKRFDKPNEDAIEQIIRSDARIGRFIRQMDLNIDIVIALIYRTAYPFTGDIAKHAQDRMRELFTAAGIPEGEEETRKRYTELGWFLSVSERVAGYALGDFDRSKDLARKNAHALGWHPSVINERSVRYFDSLRGETEMFERVMSGVPPEYKMIFYNNIASFSVAWHRELELKGKLRNEVMFHTFVENNLGGGPDTSVIDQVAEIRDEQSFPMQSVATEFRTSLLAPETILITLRADRGSDPIIGYAKGGPLEKYKLRRGTTDVNFGMRNTSYLEGIGIKKGYLGGTGGHLLRLKFLDEAANRGYKYVTGYAHRDVILQRVRKGEKIEMVQKYDPDKLDYYRANVTDTMYRTILSDSNIIYVDNT